MDINNHLFHQSTLSLALDNVVLKDMDSFFIKIASKNYYFRGGDTPLNNGASIGITKNKYCSNRILAAAGIPVPKAIGITYKEYRKGKYSTAGLKFPLVAKPTFDTALGQDVLCNIKDEATLETYLKKNFKRYICISIEEFHSGLRSYRVLVLYNKVIGIVERTPAHVIGDGINSIPKLIAITNKIRKKIGEKVSLGPIKVDTECLIKLEEAGLSLDYVPTKDEIVPLCYVCNSSRGGTMTSLGKKICKENAALAIRAAKALNLNIVGFDVICEDINIPIEQSRGVFIEANHNPDISIHECPMFGASNRVSKKIIRRLIYRHPFGYLATILKKIIKESLLLRISLVIAAILIIHQLASATPK